MYKYDKLYMLNFISRLLHPKIEIVNFTNKPQFFWDLLIKYASAQLVLPAVYGSIVRKQLIEFIPTDLLDFLKEISELNHNRNIEILKQISFLKNILNKNEIDYVFLKGAALLIVQPYETLKERMIGDIDILVSKGDIKKAYEILIKYDFFNDKNDLVNFSEVFLYKNHRHLSRLIHKNYIAAVEIHTSITDMSDYDGLSSVKILKNKIKNSCGYYTPSNFHLWKSIILDWQINDRGLLRNYISLKTAYDSFFLEQDEFISKGTKQEKSIREFYNLISLHINLYVKKNNFRKIIYYLQLKSKTFNKLIFFIVKFFLFIKFLIFNLIPLLYSRKFLKFIYKNPQLVFKRFTTYWSN